MKFNRKCKECGHQLTAYTHSLTIGKVEALRKLVDYYEKHRQPVQRGKLGLDNSQYSDFSHLAYFDLAENTPYGWVPTERGMKFIYGEINILSPAGVMGNEILPPDHEAWRTHDGERTELNIKDIDEYSYKKRADYVEEKSTAPKLFTV